MELRTIGKIQTLKKKKKIYSTITIEIDFNKICMEWLVIQLIDLDTFHWYDKL